MKYFEFLSTMEFNMLNLFIFTMHKPTLINKTALPFFTRGLLSDFPSSVYNVTSDMFQPMLSHYQGNHSYSI